MIYVDSANIRYRGMIMCHVIADSDEELLLAMEKIGVNHKWHQFPRTSKSHFDICQTKKKLLIKNGAVEVSSREIVNIMRGKRR